MLLSTKDRVRSYPFLKGFNFLFDSMGTLLSPSDIYEDLMKDIESNAVIAARKDWTAVLNDIHHVNTEMQEYFESAKRRISEAA